MEYLIMRSTTQSHLLFSRVTPAVWVAFFNRLSNSACSLEELDLSGNIIDDRGAAALVDVLTGMISLKYLKLACDLISSDGWLLIAHIPQTIRLKFCQDIIPMAKV
jgi:hypothetical protein